MTRKANPDIYPQPAEEPAATDCALTVGGRPVFAYQARGSTCPFSQVWPGYQRPLDQTENASFASWDMAAPVEVAVTSARPVQTVRIRPQAAGIVTQVEGDTIRFTIAKPGQYTVEVNGAHRALHLFANPPEEVAPDPRDPRVIYFGPGLHCPGLMRLRSGQTVYLADDAGLLHTFTARADGKVTFWLNHAEILGQAEPRPTREEISSKPIKLLRRQTPLQLNYSPATANGGVTLEWSHPFQPKQPVPTSSLYPLTPGGYTVESLRYVGDISKTAR